MGQDYDVSVKLLLRRSNGVTIRRLVGEDIAEWLNIELPKVSNLRMDMLVRTVSGKLVHLELQSGNDKGMGLRQLEYYLGVQRMMQEHVRQIVLYLGPEPLNMPSQFQTPSLDFRWEVADIRNFDGEAMLQSGDIGDAMLALLTNVEKERVSARVMPELERLPTGTREDVATEFLVISG